MRGFRKIGNMLFVPTVLLLCCELTDAISVKTTQDAMRLLPRWKKGERVNFEIVKTREKSQGGMITAKTTGRTPLEIEVLNASQDGFLVSFTHGRSQLDDPKQAENPIVQKFLNLFAGHRVILELDSQGMIRGVRNWEEIKDLGMKVLQSLMEELKSAGLDQAAIVRIREPMESMLATKEQIEMRCGADTEPFLFFLGKELQVGMPMEYTAHLPNTLGGAPFPCRGKLTLEGVNKDTGLAKVSFSQTIDSAEARKVMEKTLRDFAKKIGKDVPNAAEILKTFAIEYAGEIVVAVSSGWLHALTRTQITKMGGLTQIDTIIITKKKNG